MKKFLVSGNGEANQINNNIYIFLKVVKHNANYINWISAGSYYRIKMTCHLYYTNP